MEAPMKLLHQALLLLLTWLFAGSALAQDQQPETLGKIAQWELAYLPEPEAGGLCLAGRSSVGVEHLLGLGGPGGVWLWVIRLSRADGVAAGGSHQLHFDFDIGQQHTVPATAINETAVRAVGLAPQLIEDLARSNRLVLTLDGEFLDELDLNGTRRLVNGLGDCYRDRVLAQAGVPAADWEIPSDLERLNSKALELFSLGRYDEGMEVAKQSLALAERTLGADHLATALSCSGLANFYSVQGRYAEAEPLLERSLTIFEKALGREHPDVAISLNNLAGLYESQGRYAEAEPLYKRALAIREKALGPEHPDVATSLNNLAVALPRPGPLRRGRAALQARAGDQGEGPGPGASRCGHEPEQPGRALSRPRAATPRPSRSTSARWRSGRRPWGPSIPMWPRA